MKLLQFVPRRQRNGVNGVLGENWYPAHRPLQGYRAVLGTKPTLNDSVWNMNGVIIYVADDMFFYNGNAIQLHKPWSFTLDGVTYKLWSSENDLVWMANGQFLTWKKLSSAPIGCDPSFIYGPLLKNLKPGGVGAVCEAYLGPKKTRGNVFSFSGYSRIRPATTNVSKTYYSDTAGYLQSRANSFMTNSTLHKAPGIKYVNPDGSTIWPVINQSVPEYPYPVNSSLFVPTTLSDCPTVPLRVYKPNNSQFSVQGAVDSSTRLMKLRNDAEAHKKLSSKKVETLRCKSCTRS